MYSEEVRGGGTALSDVLRSRVAPRAKALMLKQTVHPVLVCETTCSSRPREMSVCILVGKADLKCRVINKDVQCYVCKQPFAS
jgi:hypothetical protein